MAAVLVSPPATAPQTDAILPAASTRRGPYATIARGAAALLSTQPLTWAATFLTTVFVPRYLGAEGFGQYSVALTLAGIVGMAAAAGVPDYLRRRVATHE